MRTLDTSGDPTASGFIPNGGSTFVLKDIADFNNDGNEDLAFQGTHYPFKITPMTGVTPGTAVFPASGGGAFTLRDMEDMNADGFFDLIVTNASNDVRIQLSNGTGATTNGALIPSGGLSLFVGPN